MHEMSITTRSETHQHIRKYNNTKNGWNVLSRVFEGVERRNNVSQNVRETRACCTERSTSLRHVSKNYTRTFSAPLKKQHVSNVK